MAASINTSTFYAVPEDMIRVIKSQEAVQPSFEVLGAFNKTKFTQLMFTTYLETAPVKAEWCDELVFQREKCPSTGRLHYQCYAHFNRQMWGGQLLKHFGFGPGVTLYEGAVYWRNPQRPRNAEHVKRYCQKLETRYNVEAEPSQPTDSILNPSQVTGQVTAYLPALPTPELADDPFFNRLVGRLPRHWTTPKVTQCVASSSDDVRPCHDGSCSTTAYVAIPSQVALREGIPSHFGGMVVCMNCVNEYAVNRPDN